MYLRSAKIRESFCKILNILQFKEKFRCWKVETQMF
ncbi:hypothetical protein SLEP1_g21209 [Rubroshorea leprosula]|uniref:Uncharacterized protein n=1 Tax=Rubroshorea leprosula TaxID=152421 RepID=A0AAV5JH78_9ROSI|nr:hypothetical protein SLEP1_g21209 [Rubroshorea leprosula]